jgi:hypothetical protein
MGRRPSLAAVSPGFQPDVLMWKRGHDAGSVLWPGGKMPPDTAGNDARRYKIASSAESCWLFVFSPL